MPSTLPLPSQEIPEEDYSRIPMERSGKILRRSIYTFLQNYQYFITTSSLLALPFSVSILLSQSLLPFSSLHQILHNRLLSHFDAAGFPSSSGFVVFLVLKLSQTITSFIVTLPFTLSFLLISKASIIQALNNHKPSHQHSFSSFIPLFNPLFLTQVCNSLVILSASATCFSLLFIAFNCLEGFGFSSLKSIPFFSVIGAILYSIILANAHIICNLAMVLSGMEKCDGFTAILKACALIRGKTTTALSLALPVNMALAAVEALFQFRIVRAYHHEESPTPSMALEGMFIAFIYAILLVLDTVISCVFFITYKKGKQVDMKNHYTIHIEIEEKGSAHLKL